MRAAKIVVAKDEQGEFEKLKKELMEAEQGSSEELNVETIYRNFSKKSVKLVDMHYWKGHKEDGYDEIIPTNHSAYTLQIGTLPEGVKFGLVYSDGVDADDTDARKFVVAIDSPARKIYAEAGPIGPIDWNVVEVKLGMAEDKVVYEDPILGGKVEAQMVRFHAIAEFHN
ncbi:uncharacterized protein LOC141609291 [Silene latifolia]|uniref:uncharacterized protein LOC141609291 n=1 Tax=Silene latifolia TaxID=37657 RepID=UPI003D76C49F